MVYNFEGTSYPDIWGDRCCRMGTGLLPRRQPVFKLMQLGTSRGWCGSYRGTSHEHPARVESLTASYHSAWKIGSLLL